MTEIRDPAIKLFGKTIPLPATDEIFSSVIEDGHEDQRSSSASEKKSTDREENEVMEEEEKDKEDAITVEIMDTEMAGPISEDNATEPTTSSTIKESSKTLSANKETSAAERTKADKENSETSILKEKTVKKPDKILSCPRCNSLDTKFCYYNNYNINQPRHFCKNCQRYWTAGGTMRNVPVGAGRRKNKNSASHYRHLSVSEALQAARTNVPESIHRVPLKPNGSVVSFNFDAPLCESMTSVLNLADKMMQNCHKNEFHRTEEQRIPVSHGGENGEEHSSGSSVTASNSKRNCTKLQEPISQSRPGFPPQMSYFPGALWACPPQWGSTVAPPPFCPSSFPLPFYPAAPYWGCAVPGPWNFPWIPVPSSPNTGSSGSGSNSPILQKHSREGETLVQNDEEREDTSKQSSSERCLWIPKTLRIDDPSEAARSSIWATLGIKDDKSSSISSGGLFKAFQSKATDRNHTMETSQVLQANPAALSRSLDFHENS